MLKSREDELLIRLPAEKDMGIGPIQNEVHGFIAARILSVFTIESGTV
ncbi:MAG: hypothetical protein WAX69_11680 [Victivallales bacterium]